MAAKAIHKSSNAIALEVSRRVIFTDRHFMVDRLHAPIAYDRQKRGWYYTTDTWMLPTMTISEGELLAFVLSVEAARRAVGTALQAPLNSAIGKIERSLRIPVTVAPADLRRHCTFGKPPALATDEKTLPALITAIQESRQVHLHYYTAERNERTERTVDPYHVHHVNGNWYLLALDHGCGKVLTFHVGRVKSLELLPETFKRDPAFDAEERLRAAFQIESSDESAAVAVRFDAYQAVYIRERQWHETQQIEELPDGGLIIRFTSSGWGEIVRWILQYGSHAEVLEPAWLRQEIAEELQLMARKYGGAGQAAGHAAGAGDDGQSAPAAAAGAGRGINE